MNTPFTKEQFFDVFTNYNTSVWPAQIIFNLLALMVIFFAVKNYSYSKNIIVFSLIFLWLWIGIVYHIIFFSIINPAAYGFGFLFILQAVLLFYSGFIRKTISFEFSNNAPGTAGLLFIFYALIIYPVLGIIWDHQYPAQPTFGLPCPTVIFTFGIFLWTKNFPKYLFIIPFLWSLLGFYAAVNFGVYEDTGLLIAGIVSTAVLAFRKEKKIT